jgi:hypothetical protein
VYFVWIWDSVANVLEILASAIFRVSVNIEASCSSKTLAELPTSTWCKHPAAYNFQIILLTECSTFQVVSVCDNTITHVEILRQILYSFCLSIYMTSLSSVTKCWTCIWQLQEVSITYSEFLIVFPGYRQMDALKILIAQLYLLNFSSYFCHPLYSIVRCKII